MSDAYEKIREKSSLPILFKLQSKDVLHLRYCEQNDYDLQKVLYVGNDLNDLAVMSIFGFPVALSNTHPEVIRISYLVTKAKGGDGEVRELSDLIAVGNISGMKKEFRRG